MGHRTNGLWDDEEHPTSNIQKAEIGQTKTESHKKSRNGESRKQKSTDQKQL